MGSPVAQQTTLSSERKARLFFQQGLHKVRPVAFLPPVGVRPELTIANSLAIR